MSAALNDVPAIHHQDFMRINHGGQPVGNDQSGLVLRHALQLGLYGPLVGRIQRAGGLVKNHDRRVFQQRAGDSHALLFSARELEATLAHHGLIARRCAHDEIMNAGGPGSLLHLLGGSARVTVSNVVFDRIVEKHRVLRNNADGSPQTGLRHIFQVLPVNGDSPLLHVIKTKQQARQRGLARTGRPHHGNGFAGRNFKTHIVQNGPTLLIVSKVDMLEPDGWRTV